MGVVAVDKDGNIYSYGKERFNGFDKKYEKLTKVDGIKDVVKVTSEITNQWFLTLTKDGTVYSKKFDGNFEKVMDNCKDIIEEYIITKNGVVYRVGNGTEVTEIGKSLKIGEYNDPRDAKFIKNGKIVPVLWDGKKPDSYFVNTRYKQYPTDIKELFYYDVETDPKKSDKHILKMVYENKDGDIVLYKVYDCDNYKGKAEKTTSKVSRSTDDITKILDFVKEEKKK